MDKLNVILDKVINYTNLTMPVGKITFSEQKPLCYPVKSPKKSAEEMLKKALSAAYEGKRQNTPDFGFEQCRYNEGKYYAYEDMAAHLEMLIKEARQ